MIVRTAILFAALLLAAAPAARAADPDAAMRARLEAAGVQSDGVDIARPHGFATIVLVSRYVPDAGPFFAGGFVGARWVGGEDWTVLSTAAMRAFGWPRLSARTRQSLARRWIENALPAGQDTRRPPNSPEFDAARWQAPTVTRQGDRVVVRAWITRTSESIAGPRTFYPKAATTFTFARDGAVAIV